MKRLIIILLLAIPSSVSAQSIEAVVQKITGTVELKMPGAADWTPANIGDRMEGSMIISTGIRSTAVLAVGNSTVLVRPVTRLSLYSLLSTEKDETIEIRLSSGRIRVDVTPPAGKRSNFSVRTSSSVSSVRGTSFEMDMSSIHVLNGTVSYAPVDTLALRPVTVSTGQESWVDVDTGSALTPMSVAEISRSLPSLPGQYAGTLSDNSAPIVAELYPIVVHITYE